MKKPKKHCEVGTYKHQVPMPINGKVRYIDFCISDIVAALNASGLETVCSCCGHGKKELAWIYLKDGRKLQVNYK